VTVDLYEAETFPRFRVGESLLPANLATYQQAGLTEADFISAGFLRKEGATFESPDGSRRVRFPFAESLPGDADHAYQVERAHFDAMLLDHACAQGVQLITRKITAIDRDGDGRQVPTCAEGAGEPLDFLIDASGRSALLARRAKAVSPLADLRRAAIYGHVDGLPIPDGSEVGDIVISMSSNPHGDATGEAGWAWQIPLSAHKTSVGVVLPREDLAVGQSLEAVFEAALLRFPALAERLAARRPMPIRSTPDISYSVKERYGSDWASIGDAAGFVDPIFSSGILLSTRAGARLADALLADGPSANLQPWEEAVDQDLAIFTAFIRLWYQRGFIGKLFFGQAHNETIGRGIISLLGGNTTHPDNQFLGMLTSRLRPRQAG
jgi:FADH2-dependent halogenase